MEDANDNTYMDKKNCPIFFLPFTCQKSLTSSPHPSTNLQPNPKNQCIYFFLEIYYLQNFEYRIYIMQNNLSAWANFAQPSSKSDHTDKSQP